MELANFIHPALGLVAGACILTAYGVRLLGKPNHTLHYVAGIVAIVVLVLAVIRAVTVAGQLAEAGIETPPVMGIHGINAMLVSLLLVIQFILGVVMWRRKPEIPMGAFMVHSIVGPLLALLVIVQIILGVLTIVGFMR